MTQLKKISISMLLMIGTIVLVFIVLNSLFPKAAPLMSADNSELKNLKNNITYTAIGDSLTEGVGDSTNSGGYVPILGKLIKRNFDIKKVETNNYGKSGDRSDQILKRLNENQEMRLAIEDATIIGITAGANDLMKIVRNNIFSNINETTFTQPKKKYKESLLKLLDEVRTFNPNAPIYVIGIYNPYYLQFADITEVQDIVDEWNEATQEVVAEQNNMSFVPINDIIYRGLDNSSTTSTSTSGGSHTSESINALISDDDNFHPNNLGYQLMADAVYNSLIQTKDDWLYKDK